MAKNKITVDTTVKRYTKKKGKGCFSLGLGDVKLSENQRNKLDDLIDNTIPVKLSIEAIQENLPGMD